MTSTNANIRGTFFTNKPLELDYDKAMKIATSLEKYKLFPFPVSGFSFQIGPGGMVPTAINGFEFRNKDNRHSISIGPDRVDVNSYVDDGSIPDAFSKMSVFSQDVIEAFSSCFEYIIVRLALASTWTIALSDLELVSARLLDKDVEPDLVEWEIRSVKRNALKDKGFLINYGEKIARATVKLSAESIMKDRIIVETDINTVPIPQMIINPDTTTAFFGDAVFNSIRIVKSVFMKANSNEE